jgi:hypothetical protein
VVRVPGAWNLPAMKLRSLQGSFQFACRYWAQADIERYRRSMFAAEGIAELSFFHDANALS